MDKTELVKELYKPFDLDDHEIRVGSTKNKAQWFVYVRREAITARLDRLFPLDWSSEIINVTQHNSYATAIMRLTISGMARENNGSQSGNTENSEKGAVTDAFKRVASAFGLGLYLQSTPQLWTNGGFATKDNSGKWRTDYKEQNRQEKEAFNKFAQWHKSQYGNSKPQPVATSNGNAPQPQADGWAAVATIQPIIVKFRELALSDAQIIKFAGVQRWNDFSGWNKHKDAKAAEEAIEKALDDAVAADAEKVLADDAGYERDPNNPDNIQF
ncbi:MAG: Rad52/Rad22 family DNA repair protein [Planctomycetota bacterium]|jgi:hypothetical protein